eukprot:6067328-Alexandrium_andersonii.AAC.1
MRAARGGSLRRRAKAQAGPLRPLGPRLRRRERGASAWVVRRVRFRGDPDHNDEHACSQECASK